MSKKENTWELVKFLITGVACAAADFLTAFLVSMALLKIPGLKEGDFLVDAISLLIGFLVGVTLNYILSTFWVFKGKQDSNVTKSTKFIILFVIFSAIAYGLSLGTFELCRVIIRAASNLDIQNATESEYIKQFTFFGDALFWFYVLAFVLKTLVGLIWNYFTRKYILYKKINNSEEAQEK